MERGQSAVTCAGEPHFPGSGSEKPSPSRVSGLGPGPGLPQFTLKVLLTKESKTSGLLFVATVIIVSDADDGR